MDGVHWQEPDSVIYSVFIVCGVFLIAFICILRAIVRFVYDSNNGDPRFTGRPDIQNSRSGKVLSQPRKPVEYSKSQQFVNVELPSPSAPRLERGSSLLKPPTYQEAISSSEQLHIVTKY